MRAATPRQRPQRHLAWLLWLALLLPIAQSAAAWHAVQHQASDATRPVDGKSALHLTYCDLCLAGAAINAGAPPAVPLQVPAFAARQALPALPALAVRAAAPPAAYLSRAPPSASR
ncbi:hypothetical protein [Aquabacterium sp.]|uniref:hypothetical protein n=1 Tax=Aquabacterium sp. TaxID=1872578 RepID=UPI0037836449